MSKNREELLQALIEKMLGVVKSVHTGEGFPFGEFKLSRPQVMLLFFIAKKKEGVSVKELAIFLNVTSGAITQFIDILFKKGLVTREEDLKDRRILRIKLTQFAKNKLAAFKKNYYKAICPIFDGLNEKEIKQFLSLFNKIQIVSEAKNCDS